MKYLLPLLGIIFFLSGCAGGEPYLNPLPAETRNSIFISSVQIDMSEIDQDVSAGELEKRARIGEILQASLTRDFQNTPSGSNAAIMQVNLSSVSSSEMSGLVTIVRESDSEALVTYDVRASVNRSGFSKLTQGGDRKFTEISEQFSIRLQDKFLN